MSIPAGLSRRGLLRSASVMAPVLLAPSRGEGARAAHAVCETVAAPSLSLPPEQRPPFGWPAVPIPTAMDGGVTILKWPPSAGRRGPARLRMTVAVDVREVKSIEAALPSGRLLGVLDARWAPVFQPVELLLSAEDAAAAVREGVSLRVKEGASPLWIFPPEARQTGTAASSNVGLLPHLLFDRRPHGGWNDFYDRLLSLDSLQMFGWMEGCVLDGLCDLAPVLGRRRVMPVVQAHLDRFFTTDGHVTYEAARSAPLRDRMYGIEYLLPLAALARTAPAHAAVDMGVEFCLGRAKENPEGVIRDGDLISTEGAYTVAYVLAEIARARSRPELMEMAVRQLEARRAALVTPDAIFQNATGLATATPGRRMRNWARGVAWYLLGLARTLPLAGKAPGTAALVDEFRRAASQVVAVQGREGLWRCFLDDTSTAIDTSGSAGIAAALAIGHRHQLLPAAARRAALRTRQALPAFFTPDGFLAGAAQVNRGGEALQRSDYRVIFQTAMGLTAQLEAALRGV